MGWLHVKPGTVQALNETTFLATYASGILAEEIGSAVEKIENWLGKPVVITCDEVTTNQLPQVIEHARPTTGVNSVMFNTQLYDKHSDSNQSVQNGYSAVPGAPHTAILNKILGTPCFSGTERDARKNFNEQLVRPAINKSCMGDVADSLCCLPPGATLDSIIEKFKWLYGSVWCSVVVRSSTFVTLSGTHH